MKFRYPYCAFAENWKQCLIGFIIKILLYSNSQRLTHFCGEIFSEPREYVVALKTFFPCLNPEGIFVQLPGIDLKTIVTLPEKQSCSTTKPTKWHVRPAKTSLGPKVFSCGQGRFWSDWAAAQADSSLRWAHRSFCFCCAQAEIRWAFDDEG